MKNILETRDVVIMFKDHIRGRVLDFGSGRSKYRELISSVGDSYTSFDAQSDSGANIIGDVLEPSIDDGSFDTIVCTQVLEHVSDPSRVMRHISRMLSEGGITIVTAPFMFPYHADPDDYFRYSVSGMRALAEQSGLKVIKCGPIGGFFLVFSEIIRFSLTDPYRKSKPNLFARQTVKIINKISRWLDRRVRVTSIYSNTYLVAQKPARL